MARVRHRSLFFGITSRALMLISAGLLVLSYVSVLFNPANFWFMTLWGLLFLPLWLLNASLFIWAVLRKSRAGFIPLLALSPTLFFIGRYYRFASSSPLPENGVKVVSYNVGRYKSAEGISDIDDARDSIVSLLQKQNADIICLQECRAASGLEMKDYFRRKFKGYDIQYFVYKAGKSWVGNVTMSKLPLVAKGGIDFEESSNLALWCEYRIGEEKVRIYNCHFESYAISPMGIARAVSKDNYKELFHETEEKMKTSISRRPRQVAKVLTDIENSPVKSIVAGDFNDTPMSFTYNRLLKGRKDSFSEAGHGTGATYDFLRPLLRIDYTLYPENYKVLSHKVIYKKFSDHYPIVSSFEL